VTASLVSGAGGSAGESDLFTGIENLRGGAGDDELEGSTAANVLEGGAGADQLRGLAGNDVLDGGPGATAADALDGGPGIDEASYAARNDAVRVDLGGGTSGAGNGAEGDVLTSVERARGGSGDDEILGSATNNVLAGGPGDDSIIALGGNDELRGEAGADVLFGGAGNDELLGDDGSAGQVGADMLFGEAGDDLLDGGSFGLSGATPVPNVLVGGPGDDVFRSNGSQAVDTVSYEGAAGPVVVDLAAGTASGEDEDALILVENVRGSAHADTITGDARANRLEGLLGDDVITGGDGADELDGGFGEDSLFARDGFPDRLVCGPDLDEAVADTIDVLDGSCEARQLANPDNRFSFVKVKPNKRRGTARLVIAVPGPGSLSLKGTRSVRPAKVQAESGGKVRLLVRPRGRLRKRLRAKGRGRAKVQVTFRPFGGDPRTKSRKVALRMTRTRKR